jgi:hypothetical protein
MPIQVRGVLVHAMSGTELSRVRTEFRLRLPEPINKSSLESRGPTLLCNQVLSHQFRFSGHDVNQACPLLRNGRQRHRSLSPATKRLRQLLLQKA